MEHLSKHLEGASRALRTASPATSASSASTLTLDRTADTERRHQMLVKLFAMYPAQGSEDTVRLRLLAYHGELANIHTRVLGYALRKVTREKRDNADYLPTTYQIRRAAAQVVREDKIHKRGGDPNATPTHVPFELTDEVVERTLASAPKPGEEWQPHPALAIAAGATPAPAPAQLKSGAA